MYQIPFKSLDDGNGLEIEFGDSSCQNNVFDMTITDFLIYSQKK